MNEMYVDTVRLMLGIAPIIFDTPLFAMKGGTALSEGAAIQPTSANFQRN